MHGYMKKISQGVILALVIIIAFLVYDKNIIFGDLLMYEVLPSYTMSNNVTSVFGNEYSNNTTWDETVGIESRNVFAEAVGQDMYGQTGEIHKADSLEDYENLRGYTDIIGINDIIYQQESDGTASDRHTIKEELTLLDIEKLRELDYMRSAFYTIGEPTEMTSEFFDVDKFINADLKIDNSTQGPKILIFHTHSVEFFKDSDVNNMYDGVVGLGEELTKILKNKYEIDTIHHMGRYDIVDGKPNRNGSYERMEPEVRSIISGNPSLQVAIDLHRDGVLSESTRFVQNINGKPTAQLMFVNGLSMIKENGKLEPIQNLPNSFLNDNLAFSFNMQLMANEMYPSLTRKVYLNAYRYSLHMLPKSLLVEVGAQTNTMEEAFNAMEPLADILASVILK